MKDVDILHKCLRKMPLIGLTFSNINLDPYSTILISNYTIYLPIHWVNFFAAKNDARLQKKAVYLRKNLIFIVWGEPTPKAIKQIQSSIDSFSVIFVDCVVP